MMDDSVHDGDGALPLKKNSPHWVNSLFVVTMKDTLCGRQTNHWSQKVSKKSRIVKSVYAAI